MLGENEAFGFGFIWIDIGTKQIFAGSKLLADVDHCFEALICWQRGEQDHQDIQNIQRRVHLVANQTQPFSRGQKVHQCR
jgi:hypothetical protein